MFVDNEKKKSGIENSSVATREHASNLLDGIVADYGDTLRKLAGGTEERKGIQSESAQ